ncbi:hypothetical protein BCR41DRAFT_228094 [Lobosporangium transversale]|uniref:Uncharacterized protein n=1 Tax=Lobosporangium transversale TaxID=64571 RepID=A0A1Y2G7L4_9FUNG|nr:hypothetical protein BCR41DRAFT_228094 [Lobosporangium transversale]ORY97114.1 hypothetical protein BCR41DRAFT_228094 [Lobosporangium transversale]|eukprot:XP_021875647.1 hypothetical protein BCR41DRAFT_228094 [Lobosporangium transversale]
MHNHSLGSNRHIGHILINFNLHSDVSTISQKLNTFLNTFDEAYHEMIQAEQGQAEFSIEKLYGDCSEIMATLFGTIEREMSLKKTERAKCMQEPINKALVLINLILKTAVVT